MTDRNRVLKRFLKHRVAVLALIMLVLIMVIAIFAPVIERYPYEKIDLRNRASAPSAEHWLGTDRVGRDVWSRTIHGARVSLLVGFGAVAFSVSVGTLLGALAGYYGGWVDMLIMRFTDLVMTFPALIIMITLAAFVPRSVLTLVLIIGGLSWPGSARLVRAQFLSIRETEYVMAARCLGIPNWRIILLHIMPNAFTPLVAVITFGVGAAILTEAGLSFLGLGVPPPAPSWGNMMETARNIDVLQNLPWTWLPPAIMTVVTVLCVNFVGDGLRDAIDPRLVL
jgi:peptide/nickel transport system permease protein